MTLAIIILALLAVLGFFWCFARAANWLADLSLKPKDDP